MSTPFYADHVRIAGRGVETVGLGDLGQQELFLPCPPSLIDAGLQYAQTLVAYVHKSDRRIASGEKVACGSWMLRFVETPDGMLQAEELDPSSSEYIPGASNALLYWMQQHEICAAAGASFDPFRLSEMIAASMDLAEHDAEAVIEGFRYPAGPGRVALYLLSPAFDGDYGRMKVHHAYHMMEKHPQIIPYLGLPAGYCFYTNGKVWFEGDLLNDDGDS
jgi:hypothetical protein